jgi:flagellar basal body-associated protein FliL
MKKTFFILVFLIIGLAAAFLLSKSSMSVSDKIKSFYSNTEEVQSAGEGPPIKIKADELSVLEEAPDLSDAVRRRIIVIGEVPLDTFTSKGSTLRNTMITVVVVLSVILVAVLWYRFYKKRSNVQEEQFISDSPKQKNDEEKLNQNSKVLSLSNTEINEVRVMLRQWEKRLSTFNKRRNNETISEWFQRIKGPVEIIPLYEKVRYGYAEISKDEFEKFTARLK